MDKTFFWIIYCFSFNVFHTHFMLIGSRKRADWELEESRKKLKGRDFLSKNLLV